LSGRQKLVPEKNQEAKLLAAFVFLEHKDLRNIIGGN
jgi:hypothetical protein